MSKNRMIEINLNAPRTPTPTSTPEERQVQFAAVPADGVDEIVEQRALQPTHWSPTAANDGKPRLRFYSVGPSTYQLRCPMCHERADAETVAMRGFLGQLSCMLSVLSCCFPIFSLSFLYFCLQSHLKTERLFCNRCGGHLGFYCRPT